MTDNMTDNLILMDEIDRIPISSTNRTFQRDVGRILSLTSFDTETERYKKIRQDLLISRERLRQLEEFVSARVIALKPDAIVPVHNFYSVNDYFLPEEYETLNPDVLWRRNNGNYQLALVDNKPYSQSKPILKTWIETTTTVFKEDTFLELFYKTPEGARFRVNSLHHYDGVGIMKCNVDLEDFGKFHETYIEYSELRKKTRK